MDHRHDQAVVNSNSKADINILVLDDRAVAPRIIDLWVFVQRCGNDLDEQVREGHALTSAIH